MYRNSVDDKNKTVQLYIYLQKNHQESNEWCGAYTTDGSS